MLGAILRIEPKGLQTTTFVVHMAVESHGLHERELRCRHFPLQECTAFSLVEKCMQATVGFGISGLDVVIFFFGVLGCGCLALVVCL